MRRIARSSSSQTAEGRATADDARPRHPSRHKNRRIPSTIHTTPQTSKLCTNWSFFPLVLSHPVCIKNGPHIQREQQQSGLSQVSATNGEALSLRHHTSQLNLCLNQTQVYRNIWAYVLKQLEPTLAKHAQFKTSMSNAA